LEEGAWEWTTIRGFKERATTVTLFFFGEKSKNGEKKKQKESKIEEIFVF